MVEPAHARYEAHIMPLLLLVDDEIDLLRPLDFSMRREGFQTRLARTGAEALTGVELYIAREKLPPPEEDEFYLADLVGRLAAVAEEDPPVLRCRRHEDVVDGVGALVAAPRARRHAPTTTRKCGICSRGATSSKRA